MRTKKIVFEVPCTLMRGGTSKGVFFYENDIPDVGEARDSFLCAVMGSPDERQIDGLGGSDPLTSKVAIIKPIQNGEIDIEYTFAQVGIDKAIVDYKANCGNITSAAGLFAVYEGLVKITEPETEVKIWNTNTGKILKVYIPCKDGKAIQSGDFHIDGVPGTGPQINIDFSDTIGAVSGKLLPTGKPVDMLQVPGYGSIECSIVDIANPLGFVRASDLGLNGRETPAELKLQPEKLKLLETIRSMVAKKIGLVDDWKNATSKSPAIPLLSFVSAPTEGDDLINIVSRVMFMQVMHKTYSATAAVCTGVAANIEGTIPNELARKRENPFYIGHPAGKIGVNILLSKEQGEICVKKLYLAVRHDA